MTLEHPEKRWRLHTKVTFTSGETVEATQYYSCADNLLNAVNRWRESARHAYFSAVASDCTYTVAYGHVASVALAAANYRCYDGPKDRCRKDPYWQGIDLLRPIEWPKPWQEDTKEHDDE